MKSEINKFEQKISVQSNSSNAEKEKQNNFLDLFHECPIPDNEILSNMGLFIKRQDLSRIIFMNELYKKIINVHGIVVEFGVRWGQNLALFEAFRGMYEPYNYNRKIVGFDTFEGFPSIHPKDGPKNNVNDYSVTEGYQFYLEKILDFHEANSPISHMKKYELIQGDAIENIDLYLERNPETIIAFAYFDFDIYEPTKKCLESILPRVTKGSIIAFDELNCPQFPGETLAVLEVLGLNRYRIQRSPLNPLISFIEIE